MGGPEGAEYYTTDLQVGEQGAHVEELQHRLVDAGYLYEASGTFDDSTQQALTSFAEANGFYTYTTNVELVAHVQDTTGPLQSAEWVQKFSTDATYGHQANLREAFRGEQHPGNQVWAGQRRNETYYAEGEDASAYGTTLEGGQFSTTDESGQQVPLDTTGVTTKAGFAGSKPERMIFTMDAEGDMRVADPAAEQAELDPNQRFHHSSLAGGGAVAGAGEMKVREGTVEAVSDKSGHYQPDMAMTSQVNDRLTDGGVDTSRVTFEMGNYAPGQQKPDTLVTGTELGSYDRDGILADLRTRCRQEAEAACQRKWKPAVWERLADPIKESEIQSFFDQIYPRYEAMDDRTLFAEGRQILEGRHDQLRALLRDIPQAMGWREDPLGRFQWRWWDGENWTAKVSKDDVQSEDQEGADLLAGGGGAPSGGPAAQEPYASEYVDPQ
jgi:hypothetical protein